MPGRVAKGAAPATAGAADLGRVCAEEGIELQAWGPLGQGRFTPGSDGSVPTDPAEAAALASAGGDQTVRIAETARSDGPSDHSLRQSAPRVPPEPSR